MTFCLRGLQNTFDLLDFFVPPIRFSTFVPAASASASVVVAAVVGIAAVVASAAVVAFAAAGHSELAAFRRREERFERHGIQVGFHTFSLKLDRRHAARFWQLSEYCSMVFYHPTVLSLPPC